jgi:hypothetical protein
MSSPVVVLSACRTCEAIACLHTGQERLHADHPVAAEQAALSRRLLLSMIRRAPARKPWKAMACPEPMALRAMQARHSGSDTRPPAGRVGWVCGSGWGGTYRGGQHQSLGLGGGLGAACIEHAALAYISDAARMPAAGVLCSAVVQPMLLSLIARKPAVLRRSSTLAAAAAAAPQPRHSSALRTLPASGLGSRHGVARGIACSLTSQWTSGPWPSGRHGTGSSRGTPAGAPTAARSQDVSASTRHAAAALARPPLCRGMPPHDTCTCQGNPLPTAAGRHAVAH